MSSLVDQVRHVRSEELSESPSIPSKFVYFWCFHFSHTISTTFWSPLRVSRSHKRGNRFSDHCSSSHRRCRSSTTPNQLKSTGNLLKNGLDLSIWGPKCGKSPWMFSPQEFVLHFPRFCYFRVLTLLHFDRIEPWIPTVELYGFVRENQTPVAIIIRYRESRDGQHLTHSTQGFFNRKSTISHHKSMHCR